MLHNCFSNDESPEKYLLNRSIEKKKKSYSWQLDCFSFMGLWLVCLPASQNKGTWNYIQMQETRKEIWNMETFTEKLISLKYLEKHFEFLCSPNTLPHMCINYKPFSPVWLINILGFWFSLFCRYLKSVSLKHKFSWSQYKCTRHLRI